MRSMAIAALSAALLFGCSDDDDSDDDVRSDASVNDGGTRDGGNLDGGNLDAGLDATRPDAAADAGSFARATLESKSNSTVTGSAAFRILDDVVTLELAVSNASPGLHGAHIHVTGDCSAPNASSAGDHWNPTSRPHGSGSPDAGATSHLGDLGNILVAGDGKGVLTLSKPEWRLGDGSPTDVVGHAIVIHASEDDLVTQSNPDAGVTPGNSGARQACGVITKL